MTDPKPCPKRVDGKRYQWCTCNTRAPDPAVENNLGSAVVPGEDDLTREYRICCRDLTAASSHLRQQLTAAQAEIERLKVDCHSYVAQLGERGLQYEQQRALIAMMRGALVEANKALMPGTIKQGIVKQALAAADKMREG